MNAQPAALPPLSRRRRRTDKVARALLLGATLVALVPLVLIVYYLIKKGIGSWSLDFFTTDPSGRFFGDPGGIKSAIVGTTLIVGLATVIAVPVGIGVALYLVEYGSESRFANVVRYFVDVMTGVPSIVFGLFIYITLVLAGVGGRLRGLEGLGRAGAADAAGGHARLGGRAAARARLAARGRARRSAPRAGAWCCGSCCPPRCPAS